MELRDWILSDHAGVWGRFESGVMSRVPTDRWTERADGGGSSIAALLYHLARHQDLAVSVAIVGTDAVWTRHADALGVASLSPSAGLGETEDPALTDRLDPAALIAYAQAVHQTTQDWVAAVPDLATLLDHVPPTAERLSAAGVSADEVPWLHSMWGGRTAAWLVQWPGVGHGHAHVGEATNVRNRLGLSPF